MGAVYFYQLSRSPLEVALRLLITRAGGAGWKVLLRGGDRARLDWLDEKLWLGEPGEFLAHGRAGGTADARQPVLLAPVEAAQPGQPPANDAQCLIAIDGAPIAPAEAERFERLCLVFDGADPAALGDAREQWKALTGAGVAAQYWSEESGRWEKKAERG